MVLVSLVRFDIRENCTRVNCFVRHQIKLYLQIKLTIQIAGCHLTLSDNQIL